MNTSPTAKPHPVKSGLSCAVALGIVFTILMAAIGASSAFARTQPRANATNATVTTPLPIILVATTGFSWAQLADALPTASTRLESSANPVDSSQQLAQMLLNFAAQATPANLIQRTAAAVTCPADAWLSLSAGERTQASTQKAGACTWPTSWQAALNAADASAYTSSPGALADALAAAGASATAVGAGAELALTRSNGQAPVAAADLNTVLTQDLPAFTLVDSTRGANPTATLLADLTALSNAEVKARIIVASIADADNQGAQAIILPTNTQGWKTKTASANALIASASTHQSGFIQLTDLTATILSALNINPATDMSGQALILPTQATVLPTLETAQTVTSSQNFPQITKLIDLSLRAKAANQTNLPAALTIVGAALLLVFASALSLRGKAAPQRLLRIWAAANMVAALPFSAWVAVLIPWWRFGATGDTPSKITVCGAIIVMIIGALIISALAYCLATVIIKICSKIRPKKSLTPVKLRRALRLSTLILSTGTCAVLLLDAASGSHLGFNGTLGMDAVLAGRFYGMSNPGFAICASALLLTLAVSASASIYARPQGWARLGAIGFTVGLPGLIALALDGLPQAGADVGGALALTLALAVLMLSLYGNKIGWRKWLLSALVAVLVVSASAVIDYLHGSSTHMGRFIGQIKSGSALATVARKLWAIVAPFFTHPLAVVGLVVALGVVLGSAWWLRQQVRAWKAGNSAYATLLPPAAVCGHTSSCTAGNSFMPIWFLPAIKALATVIVVEVLVNDSGLAMACMSAAVLAPFLLAFWCAQLTENRANS